MIDHKKISIIENNKVFSPYYFYNEFLGKVALCYSNHNDNSPISYRLTDDEDPITGKYRIDPIAIPLLLSLSQQISKNQNSSIKIELSNYPSTVDLLEFLMRSDFFYVAGDNKNPSLPLGRNILSYDDVYLGGFIGKTIRPEHKVRCYSLNDDQCLKQIVDAEQNEDKKRDILIERYSYYVSDHFESLLRESTNEYALLYVDILSELIVNGIKHSKADVFALMFSDRFSTKFSISDNGIGLYKSLEEKHCSDYYDIMTLFEEFRIALELPNTVMAMSYVTIFVTLFYSMTKQRLGLFDLMINVVNKFHGYFRLHNNHCQIIVSARLMEDLIVLEKHRHDIRELYRQKDYNQISNTDFIQRMTKSVGIGKDQIIQLAKTILNKYSNDARFSALRTYKVKFSGVHVEVEIPK